MINDIDIFDARLDDFLLKRMSQDEEQAFLTDLKLDPEKLSRAQVIALTIEQMHSIKKENGEKIINIIKGMGKKQFLEEIKKSPSLEAFDEEVTRFLKNEMTDDEEISFKKKLKDIPSLKERAKAIAMTIKGMHEINKDQDKTIIEDIKNLSKDDYIKKIHQPETIAAAKCPKEQIITIPLWKKTIKYAAAACVAAIIGIGGFQYYQYNETIALGEKYSYDVVNESRIRGIEESRPDYLNELIANLKNNKDLNTTAKKLETLYQKSTSEEYNEYSNYSNLIGWNAAIAYLKSGHRKKARIILIKIRDANIGKAIADEADALIKEIDKI